MMWWVDGDDDDDDDHDDGDHDDHDDCKCGATSGLGRTCLNIILQHAQTPAQGQCFEISQTTNPKL